MSDIPSDEENPKMNYARVRFIEDGYVTTIPLEKITEFSHERLTNSTSFDKQKIYTALWLDKKTGEEIPLGVQIAHICSTADEAKDWSSKRSKFCKLNYSTIHDYEKDADSSEDYDNEMQKNIALQKLRKKKVLKKAAESDKKAQQEIFKERMNTFIQNDLLINDKEEHTPVNSSKIKENNAPKFTIEMLDQELLNCNYCQKCEKLEVELQKFEKENKKQNRMIEQLQIKIKELQKRYETLQGLNEKLQLKLLLSPSKNSLDIINKDNYALRNYEHDPIKKAAENKSSKGSGEDGINHVNLAYDPDAFAMDSRDLPHTSTPKSKESKVGNIPHSPLAGTSSANFPVSSRKRLFSYNDNTIKGTAVSKKTKTSIEETMNDGEEQNRPNTFLESITETVDGQKIRKYNLGLGITIEQDQWRRILSETSASKFTKLILRHMYTQEELVKRSVKGDATSLTPHGKNSRKLLTPEKNKLIGRCLRYFVRKRLRKGRAEEDIEVAKRNHYIYEEINDAIKRCKKAIKREEERQKVDDELSGTELYSDDSD